MPQNVGEGFARHTSLVGSGLLLMVLYCIIWLRYCYVHGNMPFLESWEDFRNPLKLLSPFWLLRDTLSVLCFEGAAPPPHLQHLFVFVCYKPQYDLIGRESRSPAREPLPCEPLNNMYPKRSNKCHVSHDFDADDLVSVAPVRKSKRRTKSSKNFRTR